MADADADSPAPSPPPALPESPSELPPSAPAAGGDAARSPDPSFALALGLSRGDLWFACVVGGVVLLLLIGHWGQRAWNGARPVEIDRLPSNVYEFRLDINSATWVEWMQLDGIGDVLARRIVENRNQFGRFSGIDDLRRVPGIGEKTLDDLRPHLICNDCLPTGDAP